MLGLSCLSQAGRYHGWEKYQKRSCCCPDRMIDDNRFFSGFGEQAGRLVHYVHQILMSPAENPLDWCIWCTMGHRHPEENRQNGALRAPIWTGSIRKPYKLAR